MTNYGLACYAPSLVPLWAVQFVQLIPQSFSGRVPVAGVGMFARNDRSVSESRNLQAGDRQAGGEPRGAAALSQHAERARGRWKGAIGGNAMVTFAAQACG